jgi:Ca2+-binding EF-hand superfamily protein
LSLELGHPLNEEQLEKAVKDLDLNNDGVIDLKEFSRWYFTGLKSYNDGR